MIGQAGEINGWTCDTCGETTYVVHVADGLTPVMLACRAEGVEPADAVCQGTARSIKYPPPPIPARVIAAVRWEWYKPDAVEEARFRNTAPAIYEQLRRGGVWLRPLTDAGRALLGVGASA